MNAHVSIRRTLALSCGLALLLTSAVVAQRGGRGGGGGGGGMVASTNRLDILTTVFTLDKDQKNKVKTILDDGYKGTAPVRGQLTTARTAIAAAIQAGKPQAEIDKLVHDYAVQATAMTSAEMKALADITRVLNDEQKGNASAAVGALYLMRGMFINDKKWNISPDGRGY
jgi:Spy/CpxP family protein refolding chaperone